MRVKYEGPLEETFISGRAYTPDKGPIKQGEEVDVHDLDGQQLVETGEWSKVEAEADKKAIAKASKEGKTIKVEEVQSQQ